MTNAVLPLARSKRSVWLPPMLALTAVWTGVSAGMLTVVHSLDYWLFSANLPAPRNPEELLAMADRLSENQPGHDADLRSPAEGSKHTEAR